MIDATFQSVQALFHPHHRSDNPILILFELYPSNIKPHSEEVKFIPQSCLKRLTTS